MTSKLALRPLFSTVSLVLGLALISGADARPYRGGIQWSFLLCKFSDSPAPPNSISYYQNMTIDSGAKGLDDYVTSISHGQADLSGSTLHGWYTEPHTLAYEQGLSNRYQRVQDCIDAAAASTTDKYVPPSGSRIYVITSPGVDLAGWENQAAIGGDDVALPEIAHEFGHGVGLNHSWSNDVTWKDATWSGGGEYDNPWDLMSAANVYVDPTGSFGGAPPDLDAHHLDEMGWIPKSRVETLGVDGILSRTITLAALTHPEESGALIARIPFDANDRFHYYTVEYRTPDSWDSGIPAAIVMINEVKNNGSYYQTTLIRELGSDAGTGNGPPVQSLNANGVAISVKSTSGNQATIEISTQYALPCAEGYVWREASSIDRVCVPPKTRTQAAADNAAANSRHLPNSTTCVQGFVWREAYPGDVVCVTTATRAQAKSDDATAYDHVNQTLVTYGPNTCQNGFVWRDGDDSDYVCVSGQTRSQVAADNAAAAHRHVAGSDTCVQGFVWREAWPNDHVCVTTATRSQAQADNGQATGRLWKLYSQGPSTPSAPGFGSLFGLLTLAQASEPAQITNPPLCLAPAERRQGPADDGRSSAPSTRWFGSLLGLVSAARASELDEPMGPPPVSEAVMRTRLAKMGYTEVPKLERSGNYWEATVVKNGATQVLRFHVQNAEKPKEIH
jgi:hypothetical protein